MKADQIISIVFAQLRPSLGRVYTNSSSLRPFSQLAAVNQRVYPRLRGSSAHTHCLVLLRGGSLRVTQTRQNSNGAATASPSATSAPTSPSTTPPEAPDRPAYELTFTCKPCRHRSTHNISKQGYHHGTVLITCPDCKNRHVISDHLKIFAEKSFTIEDLLQQKGELVKRGTLGEGDVEFWDDETTVQRGEVEQRILDLTNALRRPTKGSSQQQQ